MAIQRTPDLDCVVGFASSQRRSKKSQSAAAEKAIAKMRRAISVAAAGTWPAETPVASVTLSCEDRHRRRIVLTTDDGAPVLLDLQRATVLADGDGLVLDGGGWIAVRAAAEAVIEVRGHDPAMTARLAWHLGNRHAALQVLADGTLRLRDEPVLAAMLRGLGAEVRRTQAPFTPEPGAYAGVHQGGYDGGG